MEREIIDESSPESSVAEIGGLLVTPLANHIRVIFVSSRVFTLFLSAEIPSVARNLHENLQRNNFERELSAEARRAWQDSENDSTAPR